MLCIKRRKKLSNVHISDLGNIPVYSTTTENNGIIGYTEEKPDYTVDATIPFYIIFGDHTKSMYIATTDFCVMDNVKVLIPKIYNEYAMQFIFTVWQKAIPNLGYARHWSVAEKTVLKLPVDTMGKPDWQYMEEYMRNIEVRVGTSISKLESAQGVENSKIDINGWGEFTVGNLFNIKPTKAYKLTNAELLDGGENPVVVNSAYNNGIGGTSSKDATEKGNMITFSDTVDANTIFYQEYPFVGYPHVQGLYPIGQYATYWNKTNLIFFASSFRKSALVKGFDYGNKFRRDIASTLKVKLPINSNGDPDWIYMENYMKEIEIKVKGFLHKIA